jgi:two-component system, OmpR family, sensor histidine kinase SenX3
MTLPSFENARWYALVGALAAVLTLLAALQYQSGRRVNDATTEQMLTHLEGALVNLRQGLESELTPLCRELQQNETRSQGTALPDYGRRFERWRRAAAHPGLVTAVYVWQPANSQSPDLFQLDFQRNEFGPAEWPAGFTQLHQRLQDGAPRMDGPGGHSPGQHGRPESESLREPELSHGSPPPRGAGLMRPSHDAPPPPDWMVDENTLVLLHPAREEGETAPARGRHSGVAWILVALNVDVLRSHIIPELAQRYFGAQNQLPYQIAVILKSKDRDKLVAIYSSDSGFAAQSEVAPDARLNLFGPPMPIVRRAGTSIQRFTVGVQLAGEGQRSPDPDPEPFRIEPVHYPSQDQGWEIIAKHREGSVEAAVSSLYHRNLVFNFAVLLVLAATAGMIVVNSRRARRLAQLQMDFVASVSHELRTPLTGIISAAQNIVDGVVGDKNRMAHYGTAIVGQAQQLTELIEQILLFSATEKDRFRYHFQSVRIEDLIEASLSHTSALIRSAGVTVEAQIQQDLPPLRVDVKAFSQCLQNLITNAVKYGGEQRWVGIKVTQVSRNHGKEIRIAVEDKGIGIGSDDLEHVFEPFYRSPVATAAQIHGSGLGLPLAKTIAEAMGGRLTVESIPDKGSTFTVHLPTGITREGKNRL